MSQRLEFDPYARKSPSPDPKSQTTTGFASGLIEVTSGMRRMRVAAARIVEAGVSM